MIKKVFFFFKKKKLGPEKKNVKKNRKKLFKKKNIGGGGGGLGGSLYNSELISFIRNLHLGGAHISYFLKTVYICTKHKPKFCCPSSGIVRFLCMSEIFSNGHKTINTTNPSILSPASRIINDLRLNNLRSKDYSVINSCMDNRKLLFFFLHYIYISTDRRYTIYFRKSQISLMRLYTYLHVSLTSVFRLQISKFIN